MSEIAGYLLRIASEKWVNQVFDMAVYYTSLSRKWRPGQMIFFVHKTSSGDALIGYGVVDRIAEKDELSEEEKSECQQGGWRRVIEFKYVKKFEKPLLVNETSLRSSKRRGRFLHGLGLTREESESILKQAQKYLDDQKS